MKTFIPFGWRCPFCDHNATITDSNFVENYFEFSHGNKYGFQAIRTKVITCPNSDCREYSMSQSLHNLELTTHSSRFPFIEHIAKKEWQLIPAAEMKIFPSYVPDSITADYKEACLIRDLSPKASATLSRRCLQGMIRDFWDIKKARLVDEIEALSDRVDPMTWAAIDAVRKIGNIGAHMERDINVIVDVEPKEAQLLIGLIETLIKDWYVTKHDREKRNAELVALAGSKKTEKKKTD